MGSGPVGFSDAGLLSFNNPNARIKEHQQHLPVFLRAARYSRDAKRAPGPRCMSEFRCSGKGAEYRIPRESGTERPSRYCPPCDVAQ